MIATDHQYKSSSLIIYLKLTAQDGTADAVAAQLAELPGMHADEGLPAGLDPPPPPP